MYSLMLAAALSTSAAAPDCCWVGGSWPCGYYGCGVPCAFPPWFSYWGYYPCYYPYYGYWAPGYVYPGLPVASVPVAARAPARRADAPARIVVQLPEEARLFVDDDPCPLTSARRSFATPELRPGVTYQYTIRAEVTRDGRAVKQSKRIIVRAGEETTVEFRDMQVVEAASR